MSERYAFSFDGCGINDATDPYHPRIATLTRRDAIDQGAPGRGYRAHGELMAAAPELRTLLRQALALMPLGTKKRAEWFSAASSVLTDLDKVAP
jgi:hypothetical protein